MSRLLGMVLGLSLFAGSVGFAAADKEEISTTGNYLIVRQNTFLKCIADRKKWYKGYLFFWNPKYLYSRKVMAIPLEYLNKGTVLGNQVVVHCKNWRQLHDLMFEREDIKSFAIESKDFKWSKYPLRPSDKDSIRQAEEGAFEYATITPAEYWEKSGKSEFTRSENKEITERFGPFFSSLVFRESIMDEPKNVIFADNLKKNFHSENKKEFFGPRFDKVRVLIAPGYMEDPKSSHIQAMINAMKKGGVDVHQLEMNSLNDLHRNSEDILKNITSEIKSGRSIILMGASKGVPEILAALIKAKQRGIPLDNVKAFVGISGTVRGSFLADWILQPFYYAIAKPFLEKEARKTGLPFTDLRASLKTQSTEFLNDYFEKRKYDMPKEVPFYQLLGIPTRDIAMADDNFFRTLATWLWDTMFFPVYVSNDGFLEYPYNAVPKSWGYPATSAVLNGTHAILDGVYEGESLSTTYGIQKFVSAYLKTVMEDQSL